ncbi:unnamed protein product [Eruca vesicaria subsp. sativa]|uniref:Pectinesterase inhibitor domain-containing protein n=1 Tax=Eruca vesicaria subsp. sativa TaxID=29727 RepID=A0ABC8LSU3_ERUVS|nr:unnamed protein product [Eruca vesicaria subsp. sativa]
MLLTYLAVFVLLFSGFKANKEADSLIQRNCKVFSELPGRLDSEEFLKICITSLKENPETKKVRNKIDLIVVATNNAISNITNMKRIVEKFIKEKRYKSSLIKKKLEVCLKHYQDGYEWLTSGLNYLKEQDREMASPDLGMARREVGDCEKRFKKGEINPLKRENDVLYEMVFIPSVMSEIADCETSKGGCT